jgi:hypothetical protein
MARTDIIHGNRRANRRYDFPLDMRFAYRECGVESEGTGRTVNLSRGGIRFETDSPPPTGTEVMLRVAWPFLLQNVCPLELYIWGTVLRSDAYGTVVLMKKHEFRTCGPRSFQVGGDSAPIFSFVA